MQHKKEGFAKFLAGVTQNQLLGNGNICFKKNPGQWVVCLTPLTLSPDALSPDALRPRAVSPCAFSPNGLRNAWKNQALQPDFFRESIQNSISNIINQGDGTFFITFYYQALRPSVQRAQGLREWGLRVSGLRAWGVEHTTHWIRFWFFYKKFRLSRLAQISIFFFLRRLHTCVK